MDSSICIRVSEQDFDLQAEQSRLLGLTNNAGAIVAFTGIVREFAGEHQLHSMVLEHYAGMTERALTEIAQVAMTRWQLDAVTVIHRVGTLAPNDQIVLVLVAARHRGAAFQSCEFIMDYLKTEAPFWKKEHFTSGEAVWVDARESDDAAKLRWSNSPL